jgi:tryprostatin B 6-hydroxylase
MSTLYYNNTAVLIVYFIALREFERRELVYVHQLENKICQSQGRPMNMSLWFNLFSFDVMGDLAFGKPFGMLNTEEKPFAIELLQSGQRNNVVYTVLDWLPVLFRYIPGAAGAIKRFEVWCNQQVEERKNVSNMSISRLITVTVSSRITNI